MQRTLINQTPDLIDKKITLKGWVDSIRDHGKITFIDLRDRSGLIQIVGQNLPKLGSEYVIEVLGQVKQRPEKLVNPNLETGKIEIEAEKVTIISTSQELPIPLDASDQVTTTKRFNYRWLDLRKKHSIFQAWTYLEEGMRQYFLSNNYIQIYAPSFMNTPSESGSEVFSVKYFNTHAYLPQSPQFYKQMAMAAGFEKVFCIGPVFRAEPSFTTRHTTEFTGWDFEVSFINSHLDVMAIEEQMLVTAFSNLKQNLLPNLDIPTAPFPKISMAEAKAKLKTAKIKNEKGDDLSPQEEREICKIIKKETGSDFVFITDYHKSKSAFYHMRLDEGSDRSRRADLLYRGIEVTTLAQREHRPDVLEKQAKEKDMDLELLKDYLNFFRYGCPPHGGAGIGPGRFIMKILDLPNVREATYLPRDVKRLNP